jgi:putative ABC transport system ATP-binding protein
MLIARDVTKEYMSGEQKLAVLRDVSFTIPQGAFVAIVGPSGSGKTTLLGLLAGLDTPTRGTVLLDHADLGMLSENDRARLRGEKVGFVFQTFQLIPTLTALENVQVPLELRGTAGAVERARDLIDRVGLTGRGHHFPTQLSGGEQQRVAIARAVINRPDLLVADEPTGNVDAEMAQRLLHLFTALNRLGTTVVVATHDVGLISATPGARLIRLENGTMVDPTGTLKNPPRPPQGSA